MADLSASEVAIFWDYEECRPASNISGLKIVENIRGLTRSSGAVKVFKAYADISLECVDPQSLAFHSELQSSGITLVHCPHNGEKNVTTKMMIVDIFCFVLDYSAPQTIVLITGDGDFAYAAAVLRLRGHKVVVISHNKRHASLAAQADVLLSWQKNVLGQVSSDGAVPDSDSPMNSLKLDTRTNVSNLGNAPYQQCREASTSRDFSEAIHIEPSETESSESSRSVKPTAPGVNGRSDTELETYAGAMRHRIPIVNTASGSDTSKSQTNNRFETPRGSSTASSNRVGCRFTTDEDEPSTTPSRVIGGNDEDDVSCSCKICTRTTGPIRGSRRTLVGQPVQAGNTVDENTGDTFLPFDIHNQPFIEDLDVDHDSSTATPSSVSSHSQLSTAPASFSSSSKEYELPSLSSVRRFRALVEFFCDQQARFGITRHPSSIVASALVKQDPEVFHKAGVWRMKQYIEEARLANIVISTIPGYDDQGDFWIEMDSHLYAAVRLWKRLNALDSASR